MHKPTSHCDEFMLLVLCHIHCHHAVVYMLKRPWSSVDSDVSLSPDELHIDCDIHLIYLGEHIYGELQLLLMLTVPATSTHPLVIPIPHKHRGGQCKPIDLSATCKWGKGK